MKSIFILVFAAVAVVSCTNNDSATTSSISKEDSIKRQQALDAVNDSTKYTSIEWIDSVHQDLGKVTEGDQVEISWRFRNSGDKPLIIADARGGCGCTIADKPKEPIAPGGEGKIKAVFNTNNQVGTPRKDVYVMANIPKGSQVLTFSAEVAKKN